MHGLFAREKGKIEKDIVCICTYGFYFCAFLWTEEEWVQDII